MVQRLSSKEINDTDCVEGKLDCMICYSYMMKEPDFVIKMMTMYGALNPYPDQKDSTRYSTKGERNVTKSFRFTELFSNHYCFCHAVNDHNI